MRKITPPAIADHAEVMAAARRNARAGQALRDHKQSHLDKPSAYSKAGAELHPADGSSWQGHAVNVLRANGVPAERSHIALAIDSLAQRGRFSPFQARALKAHDGPLRGDAGKAVLGAVAGHIAHKLG